MATMSKANVLFLQVLAIHILIASAFPELPTPVPLSLDELEYSFWVETNPNEGGYCDEGMLPKVLRAFEDAWQLSEVGIFYPLTMISTRNQNLPSYNTFTRLRALLFIFFGIELNENGLFNRGSNLAYQNVLSNRFLSFDESNGILIYTNPTDEFRGVVNISNPEDPVGFAYELPKLRCREDYSRFVEYIVDEHGVQNSALGRAAERYGFPDLPGLMYDQQFNEYYPGTEDNPRRGYCESNNPPTMAWTLPITRTSLYG